MSFRGARAAKTLALAGEFARHQRAWFADVQARADAGEPFAMVNADAPQELFRALEIPYVVTQWWASLVAAKQLAAPYLERLGALGYPTDRESYTALGFASALEPDRGAAPWGGLPTPAFLHAVASGDAMRKLFEAWARHTGAQCLLIERTNSWSPQVHPDWWARAHDDWRGLIEADRLALMAAELRALAATLQQATGRQLRPAALREVMDLVNEQEELFLATRDLIARARPAPVSITDTMPATMIPQWHRGSEWGRDAARALHDAVAQRVTEGASVCAQEQVRLMWLGRGLWFNMAFYEAFQDSHGAVFVWSIYLGLAADGYIRRLAAGDDLFEALAARFVTMGDELRSPTWASQWHLKEALSHGVDGVVSLETLGYFDRLAFRRAGIPVIELGVSNVDPRGWDDDAVRRAVGAFIEAQAAPRAARRRAQERSAAR